MLVERLKGRDYHQSLVIPFTLLAIAPVFCISKSICIYITTLPVPLPHALHQLVHQYKSKTNRKRNNSRYTTFDNLSRMGLFQSILTLCPCSTPRKTVISPEVISHPYPLAPKLIIHQDHIVSLKVRLIHMQTRKQYRNLQHRQLLNYHYRSVEQLWTVWDWV
jgi:hypothetical protein